MSIYNFSLICCLLQPLCPFLPEVFVYDFVKIKKNVIVTVKAKVFNIKFNVVIKHFLPVRTAIFM